MPLADRLARVIRRDRETGEFDTDLTLDWLVAVAVSLTHAASGEVDAGRRSAGDAAQALRTTIHSVFGRDL
ncbi:hypothetical protein AB0K14_01705 [Actinosynnema sp. NPDC050801]|uniref:hypothetical protein n=1 Tax=unclassified Actinosynnema TaxID=2637065 RepID=UPI0033ED892D